MDWIIKKASTLTQEEKESLGISGIPNEWPIEKYPYSEPIPENFEGITSENLELLIINNQAAYDSWLQSLRPIIEPIPTVIQAEIVNEPKMEYTYNYSLKADATMGTCPANTITEIFYKLENKDGETYTYKYLAGGTAFGKNLQWGDWLQFDICDKDGIMAPPGYSIKEYICKQYAHPTEPLELRTESPGQIPIGLYLRCKVHTTPEGSDRSIFINFELYNKD